MAYRFILNSDFARNRAIAAIDRAPAGYIASIEEPRRTLDQNARLWAMLGDIAMSKPLGRHHTPDDWKAIAMNACGWECQFCEGLDGRPFPLGFRSSRLTKGQMGTLIDWLQAFGDENGVEWSEAQQQRDAA